MICIGGPSYGPASTGSSDDSSLGGIVLVLLLGVTAFIVYKTIQARRQLKQAGQAEALGEGGCAVARLSVAFMATESQLQRDLNALAESGKAGTPEGDAFIVREVCVMMARSQNAMVRYAWQQDVGISESRARSLLEQYGSDLRSRFEDEEVRADEGGVRHKVGDRDDSQVGEFVVVSVVVAFRTPAISVTPKDVESTVQAIRQIGAIGPERLLGMEVVWDPVSPEETLTSKDMDRSYSDLMPI